MIADTINNKKLTPIVAEIFIRGSKGTIFLLQNHVFKYVKVKELGSILDTFLLSKFPAKDNFNKLKEIINQALTLNILCRFIKSIQQNHIRFWLMIQL